MRQNCHSLSYNQLKTATSAINLPLSVLSILTEPPTQTVFRGRSYVVALQKGPVRGQGGRAADSIGVDLP
jgi:hypothetical protein